jgi:hypothetical protein
MTGTLFVNFVDFPCEKEQEAARPPLGPLDERADAV